MQIIVDPIAIVTYSFGMTKHDAIQYFGTQRALAAAIGRTEGAVSQWSQVPRGVQFELHVRTGGKLSVDAEYYQPTSNQRIENNAAA